MEILLKEKIVLLSLDDLKGKRENGAYYFQTALASCILLDMVMQEMIELKDKRLRVVSARIPGDPVYRDVHKRMRKKEKDKSLQYWMSDINMRVGRYQRSILQALVNGRVLRREKKRFLGIPYYLYPTLNPVPEAEFRKKLNEAIHNPKDLAEHDLALLAVLKASKSLQILIRDKNERKQVEQKIKLMLKENPFGQAVRETIDQINAVTAVIVTTAATSAAVH